MAKLFLFVHIAIFLIYYLLILHKFVRKFDVLIAIWAIKSAKTWESLATKKSANGPDLWTCFTLSELISAGIVVKAKSTVPSLSRFDKPTFISTLCR